MFNSSIIIYSVLGFVIIILFTVIVNRNSVIKNEEEKNSGLSKTIDQQKVVVDNQTKRVKTIQALNNQLTDENQKYKKECNIPFLLKEKDGFILKGDTAFFTRDFVSGSDADNYCKLAGYSGLQKQANWDTTDNTCTPGDAWWMSSNKSQDNIFDGAYYLGYYNDNVACGGDRSDGWIRAQPTNSAPTKYPGKVACDASSTS
jgi:hypothetical protein